MAATKNINIRVSPERKQALQDMAAAFGESVTEFVMKSVYARVRSESPSKAAEDPFVVAMRSAAKGRHAPLSGSERAALERSRSGRAQGSRGMTVTEARKRLAA